MHWFATIFFGLLTGFVGAIYGGFMADRAVTWLRISSFEGGSGYFVVFMILLAFVGSLVAGLVICAIVGGPGWSGALRGFGASIAAVVAVISVFGAFAWASADREPLVAGQPIDLAVEVRLPAGSDKPAAPSSDGSFTGEAYVALSSGNSHKSRVANLQFAEAREEGGSWIVPAQIPIHVTEGRRVLSVKLLGGETQFFDTPIPAKPSAVDDAFGAWLDRPFLSNLTAPPTGSALAIRYRIVVRPPPPPEPPPSPHEPTVEEQKQEIYDTLSPLAPTAEWLELTTLDAPEHVRVGALKTVAHRPDFAAALMARIRANDHTTSRDAMYLVGIMEPPPAEVGEAVREQARRVIGIEEAIDPAAEDSRDRLYDQAHVLASGVKAAAFGLRRAGVDIRPELKAMATAAREREKSPPRDIAEGCERIIAYFDKLDREAAGK